MIRLVYAVCHRLWPRQTVAILGPVRYRIDRHERMFLNFTVRVGNDVHAVVSEWGNGKPVSASTVDNQHSWKRRAPGEVIDIHRDSGKRRCEDCSETALAGGRWCWECFHKHASPPETGCGTDAGYAVHRRAKEDACRPCKAAHAAANRRRSAA